MAGSARMRLAESYKKERDWAETEKVCESMIREGQNGSWPYIELSKYYEHHVRDYEKADQMALRALNMMLNALPISEGAEHDKQQAELEGLYKRIRRIRKKSERQEQNGVL